MFTITLLTNPERPMLDPAMVTNLRNAWGGGDARWLSPDEAAEFDVPTRPDNFEAIWRSLQAMEIDLCVQESENRRKKLLLADMDCTMTQQECIDEMADVAGKGSEVREVTSRAMNGEMDFVQALKTRLGLMKGLPEAALAGVLRERITLMPGGPVLLATHREMGGYSALVSGGFTAFSGPVSRALGFDEHRANELEINKGALTGDIVGPALGRAAKIEALEDICAKLGIRENDAIAVGDGANDLGMLGRAGAGVALHAKPAVAAECDLRINFADLTGLLFLQGYTREDFVEVKTPALEP